jgi:hypothetical protein
LIKTPEASITDRRIIKAYYDFQSGARLKKILYICYSKFAKMFDFIF